MRRFILAGLVLAASIRSDGTTASFAAERTPSAVRARQIYRGPEVRPVQGDVDGPTLLRPTLEEPAGSSPVESLPQPTFQEDAPSDAVLREEEALPPSSPIPRRRPPESPTFQPELGQPAAPPPDWNDNRAVPPRQGEGNDFWVVSSRNCEQQGNQPGANCRLDYFRCGSTGRPNMSDEPSFRQSLKPRVPVCIVIHGSFTEWNTVCEDACSTYRWLRAAAPHLPLQMIFYSWPSQASTVVLPPVDVGILGVRAEYNGLYLSQLIQRLPPDSPVCLMGHSHGARAVSSCLHVLGGGNVQGYRYSNPQNIPHRIRAVYVAGAVDHNYLLPGERYGMALRRADAILNVRNCRDWALGFYEWRRPFTGHAIGRAGMNAQDRQQLGAAASRIRELDVSGLLGDEHLWPAYVRRPEVANAAVPYVYFEGELSTGPAQLAPTSGSASPEPIPSQSRYQPSTSPGSTPYQQGRTSPPGYGQSGSQPVHSARSTIPPGYSQPANGQLYPNGGYPAPANSPAGSYSARGWSAPSNSGNRPPAPSTSAPYGVRSYGTPSSTGYGNAYGLPTNRSPYDSGIVAPHPNTLGAPSPAKSPPAMLLPPQSSTQRPYGKGSLLPVPAPAPSTRDEPFDSESEPSYPVQRREKAFEKPMNRVPSIIRRYYPEASLPETSSQTNEV